MGVKFGYSTRCAIRYVSGKVREPFLDYDDGKFCGRRSKGVFLWFICFVGGEPSWRVRLEVGKGAACQLVVCLERRRDGTDGVEFVPRVFLYMTRPPKERLRCTT